MRTDINDEGLKHAYEDADKHLWTKDELDAYDYASMRKQDERGKTTVAVRKAVEKAVEKAVKTTKEEEKTETVKEFYKVGVSIENISIATKLTIEQVKQILQIL
jgi:predicted transposase/invertase (TIGR01784 family)